MRRNQGQELELRFDQVHLVEEIAFARGFGDQIDSGLGKANLLDGPSASDQAFSALTSAGPF